MTSYTINLKLHLYNNSARTISINIVIIVIAQVRFVIASINAVNINCTLTAIS